MLRMPSPGFRPALRGLLGNSVKFVAHVLRRVIQSYTPHLFASLSVSLSASLLLFAFLTPPSSRFFTEFKRRVIGQVSYLIDQYGESKFPKPSINIQPQPGGRYHASKRPRRDRGLLS